MPNYSAIQKTCGPIHQRNKNKMGRLCIAGQWKYVERINDSY